MRVVIIQTASGGKGKKANTRLFGEIDIDEEKIITLENGMIGFPDLRKFTLIFDKEKERTPSSIMWFQSMDEPEVAFPVMHPNELKPGLCTIGQR